MMPKSSPDSTDHRLKCAIFAFMASMAERILPGIVMHRISTSCHESRVIMWCMGSKKGQTEADDPPAVKRKDHRDRLVDIASMGGCTRHAYIFIIAESRQ